MRQSDTSYEGEDGVKLQAPSQNMATMNSPAMHKGTEIRVCALTVHDILSDMKRLPTTEEAVHPVTRQLGSSDTVQSSLEISRTFVRSSQKLLVDTEVLESMMGRLDRIDAGLKEVEQSLR